MNRDQRYYAKNPEKRKKHTIDWMKLHPERTKAIAKKARLKRYGLTPDAYEAMFVGQGRRCAACPATTSGSKHDWHIDHDHETGHVRGILCHHCNNTLGQAKDSIARLQALVHYLLRNNR